MEKILKIGIAGFGVVGKRRLKFINQHENMNVTAVCDKSFEGNTGIDKDGVNCYQNVSDLLNGETLDALFVCLPNNISPEVTIEGLKAGLHVFCEKPPGKTVSDISKVREVEQQHPNKSLMYGFNHRYHDSVRDALDIVKSEKLGKVVNMRGVYGKAFISPWNELGSHYWRTCREAAGGGILLDQGIHMVDLMRLFAGEFEEVKSFVSNSFWDLDVEDNAYALLKSKEGVVAMLHSTATQWRHKFSLEINLTEGSLVLEGILSGTKSYGQETLTVIQRNKLDGGNTKEQRTSYIEDNSWWHEICEFFESISSKKDVQSGHSLDALRTMELVYKVYCADDEWKNRFNLSLDM